jgi:hypothetical protein
MLNFKLFCEATTDESGLRIDNPGGEWEKNKQENAEKDLYSGREGARGKGLDGAITARYTHGDGTVKLRVATIHKIRGANDEHKIRNDPDGHLKNLEKQIGNPSNFNSKENPIHIQVNHRGEPIALEGNHRLAYAHKHGIRYVHAELQYVNGGEKKYGILHPHEVKRMQVFKADKTTLDCEEDDCGENK